MGHIETAWQSKGVLAWVLWPVSLLYRLIMRCRRRAYKIGWLETTPVSLPVVVVGNLSVGGTGKTPLCAHLVRQFEEQGWRPGIVSRGYGGERRKQPRIVDHSDTPAQVGDEPLMLFEQTQVPVCVCVERAAAVQHLALQTSVNIVFADDGLQHLAMPRVSEIIVIDGQRGLGNGWSLPAGPMRDSKAQVHNADIVAIQADDKPLHHSLDFISSRAQRENSITDNRFRLKLNDAIALKDGTSRSLDSFTAEPVTAFAGIGHPERFFRALRSHGLNVTGLSWPDHHAYTPADLEPFGSGVVLVTSKDAVKLRALGPMVAKVFEVPTTLVVNAALQQQISALEASLRDQWFNRKN